MMAPSIAGLVLAVLLTMTVVMIVGWFVQRAANNGGWTDVFWTYGTGATCALAALVPFTGAPFAGGQPTWRQVVVAILIAVWSLRLGTYVAVRVAGGDEDVRYATLRRDWGAKFQRNMFGVLIVQAPATALLSLSVLIAARNPAPDLRVADVAGVAVLVAAILGETLADRQMKRFKSDPANNGKICDIGLWSWSRHPNYFFEFVGWLAYPVIGIDPSRPWTFAAVIAPAVMFAILRFGTGVPPLEQAMLVSRGEAFRRYQARVSAFLPRPPKTQEGRPA